MVCCEDHSIPEAKLGDFGAAFFYSKPSDSVTASSAASDAAVSALHAATGVYEALEVRAFGCLIEELCVRMLPAASPLTAEGQSHVTAALSELSAQCCAVHVAARPSFLAVQSALASLVPSVL